MNPLLSREFKVPFESITAEHIEPGVREALRRAQEELEAIIGLSGPRSYRNTIQALDDMEEHLARVVGIAHHLTTVMNAPELRKAFTAVLPEFSAFFAKLPTNERLWRAVKDYADTPEAQALTGIWRRHLEKTMREFRRAGADLPPAKKARVEEINVELSQLHNDFADNVLDATNAFELVITDEAELSGLPASALERARSSAASRGVEGYRFSLQEPFFNPVMQYADNRELRRTLYQAYMDRAVDGPHDNRPLMRCILALRRELARLLGYRDFADYRLEVNMVGSGRAAVTFEEELRRRTLPYWREEVERLTAFARRELRLEPLEPWDTAYAIEKLRRASFDLDEEELRPYFPLDRVLAGLFEIARRLFGVTVLEEPALEVWHPDVRGYRIVDEDGTHLGSFYADWFPRESKRAGAWMNSFITGGPRPDGFRPHLGLIVANFTPPGNGRPALLTHREVQTTFHEFGHLLHHCLSRVEVAARAGTNVPRDWVELPSQIMENWAWERSALDLFARHVDTGEPLPEELYRKLTASRTFMEAHAQMRQLSFGTVDLAYHTEFDPDGPEDVLAFGDRILRPFALRPEFVQGRRMASFTHIFTGGYAAGYYSYKWSEVLEADAFTRFRREGVFNRRTGRDYRDAILSRGDSADPEELFREFMGRGPDIDALFERNLGPRHPMVAGD